MYSLKGSRPKKKFLSEMSAKKILGKNKKALNVLKRRIYKEMFRKLWKDVCEKFLVISWNIKSIIPSQQDIFFITKSSISGLLHMKKKNTFLPTYFLCVFPGRPGGDIWPWFSNLDWGWSRGWSRGWSWGKPHIFYFIAIQQLYV